MLSIRMQPGVVPETVPQELHLSDCAITAVGFKAIMAPQLSKQRA